MDNTIAAISTPLGTGAISIIRMSGKDSISIINKIFTKDLSNEKSHTIHYGKIIDNNEEIDEVLVSLMRSPKTFTKEDVIEINCHGGLSTTNKVLELLLNNGAVLASPGEFTKRAFLNGRIDLIEAQGIMDLIEAKTELARTQAMKELNGNLSNKIDLLREKLIEIISNIEVNIDYPEYEDINKVTNEQIYPKIKELIQEIDNLIASSEDGKIIKEGITIGIIGKPNVGKSSLLNAILEEEKAIVTDIEGTTRDTIEGTTIINGIACNFIDTAGIRNSNNIVEQIGVNKSKKIIDTCDLVLLVLNNNDIITKEEQELLEQIRNKPHIVIVNKIDLEQKLKLNEECIKISIKEKKGLEQIKDKISEIFNLEKIKTQDMTYLSNARSISLLTKANNLLVSSLTNIENNYPIDIVEIDLKESWNTLGEIIGKTYTDELLDEMFQRFCLGK
ncbi:tRNA modification GTPase MnmE [Clostridium sp. CAG:914]|nr:tRNA uridine-5-carboxymethylaminomethyl(34) synthesis GTPase MnmE [Clostridium sp.]CDE95906.1 tRNA modification GTPase MnmE [Clostridium sp. CAG:914]